MSEWTPEYRAEIVAKAAENKVRIQQEIVEKDKALDAEFNDLFARYRNGERLSEAEIAELNAKAAAEEAAEERAHKRRQCEGKGIPELHLRHLFDQEPQQCHALDQVHAFINGKETLLVLSGGVGTRKSGSACWALMAKSGSYVSAEFLSELAVSNDEDHQRKYRNLRKTPLLILDELGGEYLDDKGWFVRLFNALINHRYSNCLKTIITTNLTAAQFKAAYGERVADRIREAGVFYLVPGESVRKSKP